MSKTQSDRLHTAGWLAFGMLLIATLVWYLMQSPAAAPRPSGKTTAIALLSPPPALPPPPRKKTLPQHPVKAPPAPTPASNPLPARPKAIAAPTSPAPALDKALAMNTPTAANIYDLPQGIAEGAAIAGGGNGGNGLTIGGGGGGGCGGIMARSYLDLINSHVMQAFRDSAKTGNKNFQIRARLWFDAAGSVRQSELVDSTGDTGLDASITRQLNGIALGQNIPQCMQPIQLRVSEPWTGSFAGNGKEIRQAKQEQSETLVWKRPAGP